MKKRKRATGSVRRFLPLVAGTLAAAAVLLYQLVSLAPRLAPGERRALSASSNFVTIVNDPSYAPHKLLLLLVQFWPHGAPLWLVRLPSVLFAFTALAVFVYVLHRWYGRRSMVFGFLILLCSAWFLHVGRYGGFDIDYLLAIVSLLAAHISMDDHKDDTRAWFVWLSANLLLLFVPGLSWFVLISAVWRGRSLWSALSHLSILQRLASGLLALMSFGAIAYSIIRHSQLGLTWLGLPNSVGVLRHFSNNMAQAGLAIIYRGPHNPEIWLGTLPLLDIFLACMFLAGAFFYARHWRATRTHLLAGYTLLGFLLVSLGIVSYSLILPILYLVAVAGIAYVLHAWLSTFPRNPLARYAGISLVAVVVAASCSYGLAQYFVAWPHNPEVAAIYRK